MGPSRTSSLDRASGVPLWQQLQATEIALRVEACLPGGEGA